MKHARMTLLIAAIVLLMMPLPALSASFSFTEIKSGFLEGATFKGPSAPFAPYDIEDPDMSLDAMVEGLIGIVLKWFGVNPLGNIYGPGISQWNNYVDLWGPDMYAQGSAVGTIANFNNILRINQTQHAQHGWQWAAVYELTGNPGETAHVRFDYEYSYTYYNVAVAGRSKAATSVFFVAHIVPAALASSYDPAAYRTFPWNIYGGEPFRDASFEDNFTLKGGAEYKYLGGFKEATKQQTGSFNLDSMNVGDRLFIYVQLVAETECMTYHPPSLTVATMFPRFSGTLHAGEPEEPKAGGGGGAGCFIAALWNE